MIVHPQHGIELLKNKAANSFDMEYLPSFLYMYKVKKSAMLVAAVSNKISDTHG